jgi:hypothetical protein
MARTLPRVNTRLHPYDGARRYCAVVTGYVEVDGETRVRLRHLTGNRTVATLGHISQTYYDWT